MKKTVKVRIEKTDLGYAVFNDRGKVWEFFVKHEIADLTTAIGLSTVATSMLTATLAAQFRAADERQKDIQFELTTETIQRN